MKYKEKFRLAFDVHFLHADVCKDSSTCNRLSAFTRFHFHYPNDLAFAIPDYDVRSIERISSSCLLGEVVSSCLNLETFLFELVRDCALQRHYGQTKPSPLLQNFDAFKRTLPFVIRDQGPLSPTDYH